MRVSSSVGAPERARSVAIVTDDDFGVFFASRHAGTRSLGTSKAPPPLQDAADDDDDVLGAAHPLHLHGAATDSVAALQREVVRLREELQVAAQREAELRSRAAARQQKMREKLQALELLEQQMREQAGSSDQVREHS